MIVFRYLIREILTTMSAVTGILLLVIMGNRFIRYFSDVAEGDFPASLLGSLMLFHLPSFLQLILPLAFFLGILLAYGQLYLNSEMTVLAACGVSPARILGASFWPALLMACVVGACSLWLTPAGLTQNEKTLTEQQEKADFSALSPGRFQKLGERTIYAESVEQGSSRMKNVFIAEQARNEQGQRVDVLTRGKEGYQTSDSESDSRFLVLSDGTRESVRPGSRVAEQLVFDTYAARLENGTAQMDVDDVELQPTWHLIGDDSNKARAALQWRISLALMVPILTMIALPLSRANPRQGRFAKMMPAIILYVAYMSLLLAAQDAVGSGSLPAGIGLWPIHAVFALVGGWLLYRSSRHGGTR
ncbi:LPS export ABC transporter permease LptF [Kushneria marisflavi]|uniref:Lipopolysaccharide export system permease protein LptF n=1 Tax=Kushneria marisflavi TaxID=157779 RepID=A0A240UN78_9GAMM|nr:LPS export ABC transporter permease LptF [Kushneria marisflavi]ART62492.1 LPS export ABC transporter permease LptF [Kushneria marisflavi]RKD87619.1 lipopolysaccharide export system permease protein [Kushneria marisflavi]